MRPRRRVVAGGLAQDSGNARIRSRWASAVEESPGASVKRRSRTSGAAARRLRSEIPDERPTLQCASSSTIASPRRLRAGALRKLILRRGDPGADRGSGRRPSVGQLGHDAHPAAHRNRGPEGDGRGLRRCAGGPALDDRRRSISRTRRRKSRSATSLGGESTGMRFPSGSTRPAVTRACRCGCHFARSPWVWIETTMPGTEARSRRPARYRSRTTAVACRSPVGFDTRRVHHFSTHAVAPLPTRS